MTRRTSAEKRNSNATIGENARTKTMETTTTQQQQQQNENNLKKDFYDEGEKKNVVEEEEEGGCVSCEIRVIVWQCHAAVAFYDDCGGELFPVAGWKW